MSSRIYETMVKFDLFRLDGTKLKTVRVWKTYKEGDFHRLLITKYREALQYHLEADSMSLVDLLLAQPDVAAAEVVTVEGLGTVGYNDWP